MCFCAIKDTGLTLPSPVLSAGGTVVLFSGLISRLKADKKALTFVLAHEYSHLLGGPACPASGSFQKLACKGCEVLASL